VGVAGGGGGGGGARRMRTLPNPSASGSAPPNFACTPTPPHSRFGACLRVGAGSSTGHILFNISIGSFVYSSPAICSDGTVVIGSSSVVCFLGRHGLPPPPLHFFLCVDAGCGVANARAVMPFPPSCCPARTLWLQTFPVVLCPPPGSFDYNLYGIDGVTGAVKWTYNMGKAIQVRYCVPFLSRGLLLCVRAFARRVLAAG
jgi:hypothetical protein